MNKSNVKINVYKCKNLKQKRHRFQVRLNQTVIISLLYYAVYTRTSF